MALLGVLNHPLHPDTPERTSGNSWWGVPPGSQNPDPTKKCIFPHPFSDQTSKINTRFQTWPLARNYVIIT